MQREFQSEGEGHPDGMEGGSLAGRARDGSSLSKWFGRLHAMRFSGRLVLFGMSLVAVSVGISFSIAYQLGKQALEAALGNELLAVVNSVAPLIDGDLHQIIRGQPDGSPADEEEFESIRRQLFQVKARNRLTSRGSPIYTLRKTSDFEQTHELEFVVMSDRNTNGHFFVGNHYRAQPHMLLALSGRACRTHLYSDTEGMWISAAAPIVNTAGQIVGIVQADRTMGFFYHEVRKQTAAHAQGALLSVAVAALLATWFARTLVQPVKRLAEATRRIAQGEFRHRVTWHRQDELGDLAGCFNSMAEALQRREEALGETQDALVNAKETLEQSVQERTQELREQMDSKEKALAQLAETHRSLVDASRLAGMAEIATSVLHNVGNVLNSVNVSTNLICDQLSASRITLLRKSVDLLHQHREDLPHFLTTDSKGQTLPGFLEKLAGVLEDENARLRKEMDSVAKHVEHIKEIVSTQQSYGKVFGLIETIDLQIVTEDAIRLNAESLTRDNISIRREFSSADPINADRHQILQILVNLIQNANQAIVEANPLERWILFRLKVDVASGRISIAVSDSGGGIAPENLPNIFRHGFTTKKEGHGFGLHASVLSAREMKGDLVVHSQGLGQGGTFTLELPLPTKTSRPPYLSTETSPACNESKAA